MDKNPPNEKPQAEVATDDKPKPKAMRYVVSHIHNPTDEKPKPKPKKQDPRIGRAKRLLEQVEMLNRQANEAEAEVETHPLVDDIEAAKMHTDWLDREINQRTEAAYQKRQGAMRDCAQADLHQDEAERLQREARRLREGARVMRSEADDLDKENRRAFAQSQQDGPHSRLKDLEKRFNTETHRIAKKGREARKKAEKLRDRLRKLLEEIAPLLEQEAGPIKEIASAEVVSNGAG